VRDDIEQEVGVALDLEIEAPTAVYSCLPEIARRVVFFGAQRWMPEVYLQKFGATIKGVLHCGGRLLVAAEKSVRIQEVHRAEVLLPRRSERTISLAEEKGP